MRRERRSLEIIEILADVVKAASGDCGVVVYDGSGAFVERNVGQINYVFGNAMYIKERLDQLSLTPKGSAMKFPLVALWVPFTEERAYPFRTAKVDMLVACSTSRDWSNEQRLEYSFRNILRPIYRSLLDAIKEDGRLVIPYNGVLPHKYSENYSYGRYGAHVNEGEKVSEPIDAIDIRNLELTVKNPNCRE